MMRTLVTLDQDGRVRVTQPEAELAGRVALLRETTTYGDLWTAVSRLAAQLSRAGVTRADRVAIWMGKSEEYVECILASLLLGATYVPIDGRQPALRVRTILDDCRPSVLVLDREHAERMTDPPCPVIVRGIAHDAAQEPGDRISGTADPVVGPEDDAAILYTSGSTGVPKGVRIPHRMLANFVRWAIDDLRLTSEDRFANHASFNFDISTLDVFASLSVGASLLLLSDQEGGQPHAMAKAIEAHALTVWYSVPSALDLMVRSGHLTQAAARTLRQVVFAGEPYPVKRLRALVDLLPEACELHNYYGPTETNVCTAYTVSRSDLLTDTPLPIGRGIPGARLTVDDGEGGVVERAGVVGELVVSGTCVTTGYVRPPGEPASHPDGVHRTGDLVTWDDSGNLHYRGRIDRMVKVGGHRVELAEVERVLGQHPEVDDVAVTVADSADRRELHAHLVPSGERVSTIALRRWCSDKLPTYMIPHRLYVKDELPRTANGKVDVARLS